MWMTHFVFSTVQPRQRNGSSLVPAGTFLAIRHDRSISGFHAVLPGQGSRNAPVLSMACMMTSSLRATATAARLNPIRSFRPCPQFRRSLSQDTRVKMVTAAS